MTDAELRADCARCVGLCCVAPAFKASADFAIDKAAGHPCPHLQSDFRCGIHSRLRQEGFPGCTVYDCFGAGQKVTQVAFGGQDWRSTPAIAAQMFATFTVVRQLHELLWYLTEALSLPAARRLQYELRTARDEVEHLTARPRDEIVALDVAARREHVNGLLVRTSELARADAPGRAIDLRGADLAGKDLAAADLRGACLRSALLVGADMRDADLALADLTGADMRGADLRGAQLTESLFVTQSQLDAANGDTTTGLPAALSRPSHWSPDPSRATAPSR